MNKNRKQRFGTDDLRELEELVWRDLKAVVRAANERAVMDSARQEPLVSKGLEETVDHADEPTPPADLAPQDGNGQEPIASDGALEESALLDSDSPDPSQEIVEAAGPSLDESQALAGAEWSDGRDEQFLDGVAEWLHRQPHPDQMMAEIWCRLLMLRVPSVGPEAEPSPTLRRLQ